MNRPVIAIRPEPGCSATVEAAGRKGLSVERWPLFEIRALEWDGPDPAGVDGLLIGSANAIRHGGAKLETYRGKPVWSVGAATADAARAAGLTIAAQGQSGLQTVLDGVAPPARLLRLAGADHVALTPPAGVEVMTRIVYESRPLPLPETLLQRLPGAVIMLHSAAAAAHFAAEVEKAGLPRVAMRLAALGPRIAAAAGSGWGEVRSAAQPSDDELLDLAAEMCHDPGRPAG